MRALNKIFPLFEPDALLPIQYFETLRRKIPIEPEKRLMWAILEDAVGSFQSHFSGRKGKPSGNLAEVEEWILDTDNSWLFSFNSICETLEIDPQYLRRGLLDWKERQLAAGPAAKNGGEGPPKRSHGLLSIELRRKSIL